MVGDLSWDRAMRFDLSPFELIVLCSRVLQFTNLSKIETPQVVESADSDVVATEDVHGVLLDEAGVITAALRLVTTWSELIPVTLFKCFAIGLHRTHVQALCHVDRLLLLESG